jgi:citronellol/citronellal dehydrogenase
MIQYNKQFGLDDDALREFESVYRGDLFKGSVVLVSGAATGIGRGIAAVFAKLGATLVICGRNEERLEAAATFFREFGNPVDAVSMSIREPEAVEALMAHVWETHGRLDHLVNNAGGQFAMDAIDISYNGWRAVVDTNLNGTWYMMQNAAKRWKETGEPGNIITITATTDHGIRQMAHTVASRAGVNHLTRTLAIEWAPLQIRVNTVAPGVVASSGFNNYAPEEVERFENASPMRRCGEVTDVAQACVYLCAESGNYITGQTLTVAGGMDLYGGIWPAGKPEWYDT